jgi:osmoprotectant transport system ATP-binding protein
MRSHVLKVHKSKKIMECIDLMSRRGVNTLVILNDDDTYAGSVSVEDIKNRGKAGKEIGAFLTTDKITVGQNDDAKDAFDKLTAADDDYVVVLNDDQTVAGLITKTSMAQAMADALWGDLGA